MATPIRIRRGAKRQFFLREWMKEKDVSAIRLAERLGCNRSQIYKWLGGKLRIRPEQADAIAEALGLETGEVLQHHPGRPSLDAMLADAPDDLVKRAAEIIRVLKSA